MRLVDTPQLFWADVFASYSFYAELVCRGGEVGEFKDFLRRFRLLSSAMDRKRFKSSLKVLSTYWPTKSLSKARATPLGTSNWIARVTRHFSPPCPSKSTRPLLERPVSLFQAIISPRTTFVLPAPRKIWCISCILRHGGLIYDQFSFSFSSFSQYHTSQYNLLILIEEIPKKRTSFPRHLQTTNCKRPSWNVMVIFINLNAS